MRSNMLFSGEIYTTGKNFTLPQAVTGWTISTSEKRLFFLETTLGSQMRIYVGSLPELLRTSLPGLGELSQYRKRIPGKDLIFWQTYYLIFRILILI